MSTTHTAAAAAANSVDFIDENDARSVLFCLREQVSDAARPDTNEHLYKFRARNAKERYGSLASNCTGQHGFTSAGRADEQHALRYLGAERGKLFGKFQEFDDLLEVLLCLFLASDRFECNFIFLITVQTGTALAEAKCLIPLALRAAHHPDEQAADE